MKLSLILVCLLNLFISSSAWAWPAANDCGAHHSPFEGLVQTVSIVGPVENRFVFPVAKAKFGLTDADMQQRFTGTGEFHCPGGQGGANFLFRNDFLVLDSHAFFKVDPETKRCIRRLNREEIKQCYIQAVDKNGNVLPQHWPVDPDSVKMSNHCEEQGKWGNDWARVELKYPVPGIEPYDLFDVSKIRDKNGSYNKFDKMNTTTVSSGANNFDGGLVPTICRGIIGYIGSTRSVTGGTEFEQTGSCSGGWGTSGAGVVVEVPNQRSQLAGIVTATKESKDRDGKVYDHMEYGNDNFSAGTLIDGDFRNAVLECRIKCPPQSVSN